MWKSIQSPQRLPFRHLIKFNSSFFKKINEYKTTSSMWFKLFKPKANSILVNMRSLSIKIRNKIKKFITLTLSYLYSASSDLREKQSLFVDIQSLPRKPGESSKKLSWFKKNKTFFKNKKNINVKTTTKLNWELQKHLNKLRNIAVWND